MGKGGQQATILSSEKVSTLENGGMKENTLWQSSYRPLDPNAPQLPSKGEIKAVIPEACFVRSYIWSMFYLVRDCVMAALVAFVTSKLLSTDIPPLYDIYAVVVWAVSWSFYAFWMGTVMTGLWVLAHECGHGAFSPSQTFNDVVGNIIHHSLLVPYFAWQFTHAKHHRRTNHILDGESHVPSTSQDIGLDENFQRRSFYAVWHEAMGDGAFAAFQIWSHLFLGWPLYLLGLASTGKLSHDGTPLQGCISDHFRPNSPMFPFKVRGKIIFSTLMEIMTLGSLIYAGFVFGHLSVFLWYWCPYFVVNAWLVLYTWLQHSDPSVPHYGENEWTWVKGALSTIDRPYGIFDFFHHNIGSTHVVHHLFHEMPWYNASLATEAVKDFLEPIGLYNFDPTWFPIALWKIGRTCHYVASTEGIQYFQSLENVPKTSALKDKTS